MRRTTQKNLSIPALACILGLALLASAGEARTAEAQRRDGAAQQSNGVPAEASYLLGPEDVVEVFVWKEQELSTTATVRPDGRITLPLAGELVASGQTPRQLETEIATRLQRYIEHPVVTVMLKEINSPKIAVLGEVRRPGRYLIPQHTTILDAIAMSGGFTEFAHPEKVVVLRKTRSGATQRIRVDVKQLLRTGESPLTLQPQDTIYVD